MSKYAADGSLNVTIVSTTDSGRGAYGSDGSARATVATVSAGVAVFVVSGSDFVTSLGSFVIQS